MILLFVSLFSMLPAPAHSAGFQKGMVTFTFDDGYSSTDLLAAPILQSAGIKGTAFVYPAGLSALISNQMGAAQVSELQSKYGWEIGSEGMTKTGLTTCVDQNCPAISEIVQSKQNMTASGWTVTSFAYPKSTLAKIAAARTLVVDNYAGARDTSSGRTGLALNAPGVDIYDATSNDIKGNTTAATVQSWIDQAESSKSWLVINFKKIVSCSSGGTPLRSTEFCDNDLRTLAQYVQAKVNGGTMEAPTFTAAVNIVKGPSGTGTGGTGSNLLGLLTIPLIVVGVAIVGGIGIGVARFNSKKRRRVSQPTAASHSISKMSGSDQLNDRNG